MFAFTQVNPSLLNFYFYYFFLLLRLQSPRERFSSVRFEPWEGLNTGRRQSSQIHKAEGGGLKATLFTPVRSFTSSNLCNEDWTITILKNGWKPAQTFITFSYNFTSCVYRNLRLQVDKNVRTHTVHLFKKHL